MSDLTYRLFRADSPDLSFVKDLFESAFLPEERPPFEVLISWERANVYQVEKDGLPVGLTVTVIQDDLCYLFFLAIDPEHRNQGIGGRIVNDILEEQRKYGRRVFLLADEPEPWYEDYELRKRRIAFYGRCGLELTPIRIREFGVYYRLLKAAPCDVSKDDFLAIMRYVIGDEYYEKVYSKEVE